MDQTDSHHHESQELRLLNIVYERIEDNSEHRVLAIKGLFEVFMLFVCDHIHAYEAEDLDDDAIEPWKEEKREYSGVDLVVDADGGLHELHVLHQQEER